MKNLAIDELNKLKQAEEKAKKTGLRSPYAFKHKKKIYVF